MRIEEVPLSKRFINLFKSDGITELFPPQERIIRSGALGGNTNLILCTPTASGKTFASELFMAKALHEGKKVVYVVPLRALAYEKYTEFRKYGTLGFRVALEMGDLDSSRYRKKSDFDILVTTAEKCDSILRSRPDWFNGVGVLVMDEIHLIATDRGPVYEILIAKFRLLFGDVRILGLSATIGNAPELADWLSADLIVSEWRPVSLHEQVEVSEDKFKKIKEICINSLSEGGRVLVFVNSRRSAESVAEKLSTELKLVRADEKKELESAKNEALTAISPPTRQCNRLAKCIGGGAAFHHAGITNSQRVLIEDEFKSGSLKILVATPTLAAGVNLPSRTVIVRDFQRYTERGLTPIPVLEYKQQVGRAGRPKYDSRGEAFLIAKTDSEKDFLEEKYLEGVVEDIFSLLGSDPVLRVHILASIASGFTHTENALLGFFRSTFFGHQYGLEGFDVRIRRLLEKLCKWDFITMDSGFLSATPLGKRVSELYLDPQTARSYLKIFSAAEENSNFPVEGMLEALCDAAEMRLLYVKRQEERSLWEQAYSFSGKLYRDLNGFDLDGRFLERFKTTLLFRSWIDEAPEDDLLEEYSVAPGILHQRLKILEWLIYSAGELSKLSGLKKSFGAVKKLGLQVKYGVKEELLPLVSLKGVGRVRARKLFSSGYCSLGDIRDAQPARLKALLGEKTAESIISQAENAA